MNYDEMGFAKLDTDREKRTGFPEVVFCAGKKDEFLIAIFKKLYEKDGRAFGTRATKEQYEAVKKAMPEVTYDEVSGILKIDPSAANSDSGANPETANSGSAESLKKSADIDIDNLPENYIVVCTGGTADIPVAEEAAQTAEYFGANVIRVYDVGVSGIHRVLSKQEILRGACCVITVAGMEGALASVVGGMVSNPVIAVPTSVGYGASLGGLSALLTMINSCANGITVVNIDNGYGAGYTATQIFRLAEKK